MSTGGVSAGGLGGLTASAGATPLPNSAASDSAGCNLGASKRTAQSAFWLALGVLGTCALRRWRRKARC